MLERTTAKSLPMLNRAADLAPAAQACCGVCRSCTTTNLVGIVLAGLAGLGIALRGIFRGQYYRNTPSGIRTRATGVKGRRPRPLDDGGPSGQDSPPL